jgi:hypothetical protein
VTGQHHAVNRIRDDTRHDHPDDDDGNRRDDVHGIAQQQRLVAHQPVTGVIDAVYNIELFHLFFLLLNQNTKSIPHGDRQVSKG